MAEKIDFKNFYEITKPTFDNLIFLGNKLYFADLGDKQSKIELSNIAFGMLAHLNITSDDLTSHIEDNLLKYDPKNRDIFLKFYTFLEILKIYKHFNINPTAFPLIQKYRTAFDKYEAQLGIQNPFTKISGKEPGDN